jgi:hypothetical protein
MAAMAGWIDRARGRSNVACVLLIWDRYSGVETYCWWTQHQLEGAAKPFSKFNNRKFLRDNMNVSLGHQWR